MSFNFKMESTQFKDPKQKRLLIVAVVFFIAAGVLYWRLFFSGPEVTVVQPLPTKTVLPVAAFPAEGIPQAPVPAAPGVSEEALRRARLDTEVVKTRLFQELQLYGSYPITIPEKGNPYPFQKPPASPGAAETEGEEGEGEGEN